MLLKCQVQLFTTRLFNLASRSSERDSSDASGLDKYSLSGCYSLRTACDEPSSRSEDSQCPSKRRHRCSPKNNSPLLGYLLKELCELLPCSPRSHLLSSIKRLSTTSAMIGQRLFPVSTSCQLVE